MKKTYTILGGNGVFGVHTALYLLRHADPKKVICVGRNPEKIDAFSLKVGRGDSRYLYRQIHLVHEQDRLFELLDSERPEVIINFAARMPLPGPKRGVITRQMSPHLQE